MTPDRLLALRDYYVGNELVDGYGDVEELIEEIDRTYAILDAEREARKRENRKVKAYDAARAVVKREGFSRAEYVLRAETAEAALAEAREALRETLPYVMRWHDLFNSMPPGEAGRVWRAASELLDGPLPTVEGMKGILASASEGETAC